MPDAPSPTPDRSFRRWPADLGRRSLIMGVINLTPDSFSDGGRISGAAPAAAAAARIVAEGAAIIDVGAESTHPKAVAVPQATEQARLLPGLAAILEAVEVPVSVDTYKAGTAAAALEAGASIVNDVWGLQRDLDMAGVVARHDAGLCIMHNRSAVDAGIDIIADVCAFFGRSLEIATQAGIDRSRIVLDPGIGFGKTFDQNLICLQQLGAFSTFGLPLLVGASRKGFIGAVTGKTVPDERLNGTLAAHIAAVLKGAAIVRAHDVAAHRDALALSDAIIRGSVDAQKEET